MELRVLRYFLVAAQEESITKAAALLHITQPTLSRQLMQLEEELGVKLFRRSQYHVFLTEDGMLLRRHAQEIVELADKTAREFSHRDAEIAGEIAIGCGETAAMTGLSRHIAAFRKAHPQVQFRIYTATADDVKERMEKGLLDIGLLTEPVDVERYAYLRMPEKNRWGILVRKDDPLAQKQTVTPQELTHIPLIVTGRESVRGELAGWFGGSIDDLAIAATYNLIVNAANMVKNHVGAAVCVYLDNLSDELCFVPLRPALETGTVLAWKKEQTFSRPAELFLQQVKNALQA